MLEILTDAVLLWCISGIIFIIIEILTVTFFAAFFAVGAFAAALVSIWCDSFLVQILVFGVVSLVAMAVGKPILKKYFKPKEERASAVDAMIGKCGIVTSKITPLDAGQVKINGEVWMAIADEELDEGIKIEVERVSGAKVHVKRA